MHSFNLTLVGDQFVEGADDGAFAVQLVHGLQSDQLPEGSWEAHVLSTLTSTSGSVVRIDDSTLSVTIPDNVRYDTRAPEAISVALPASLLASKQRTRVEPPFSIYSRRGTARIDGLDGLSEGCQAFFRRYIDAFEGRMRARGGGDYERYADQVAAQMERHNAARL